MEEKDPGSKGRFDSEEFVEAVSKLGNLVGREVLEGIDKAVNRMETKQERKAVRRRARRERKAFRKGKLSGPPAGDYAECLEKLRREEEGLRTGFWPHLASYIAVNGGLMFINLQTGPFPWALFPLGGWGIGLLEHLLNMMRKTEARKALERQASLSGAQLEAFHRLEGHKDAFWNQLVSSAATSAFLAMIGAIIPATTPWIYIPIVFMGLGLFGHLAGYLPQRSRLERELRDHVRNGPPVDLGPYASFVNEAEEARDAIAEQIRGRSAKGKTATATPLDDGFMPTLDSYVDQVVLLASRSAEIDRIIGMIPVADLSRDKASILSRMEAPVGENLKREYEKSLSEIDRQEKSFGELREQRELLDLKMRSSVNTLKQMRIDMARIEGLSVAGGASDPLMQQKTEELSRYLEDLKSAYSELDAMGKSQGRDLIS